jgi:ATP-dependent DNA helicase RecQ
VLATQWQLLNPVRALLEEHSIPVSLMLPSDKQPPPFRIRENADLIATLKHSRKSVSTASFWLNYLAETYPDANGNPWLEQLKDSLLDWQKETNDGEVSTQQTLEFLYETLSEQRKERRLGRGVFLTTIHSVKGMEFSHLVILDGGWTKESLEEQRRLLYVAMTRAKETLYLMQRKDAVNPFLHEITGDFSLRRDAADISVRFPLWKRGIEGDLSNQISPNPSSPKRGTECLPAKSHQADQPNVPRHYGLLGLNDFHLSFAGRFPETNPIHQHLAALVPGSLLSIANINGKVVLQHNGVTVARLSQKGHQEWADKLERIEAVRVIAMIRRYRDDCEEEIYRLKCKVEEWEIPMVELVYR